MSEEIDVAGFLYADYYLNDGLTYEDFSVRRSEFVKGLDRHLQKQIIRDDKVEEFFEVLKEIETSGTGSVEWGGGGRNTEKTFSEPEINRKSSYFDMCARPGNVLFNKPNFHFAGICQYCSSIILPRSKKDRNDVVIKNQRGDLGIKLENESFRETLLAHIKRRNHDIIINSLSNEGFVELIVDNAQGSVYTIVTSHLNKNGRALPKLIRRSDGLFFSVKEFYQLYGKKIRNSWSKRVDNGLAYGDILEIGGDVRKFAREGIRNGSCLGGNLRGFVCVSLGEHGAIVYDSFENKLFWTRLKKEPWQEVQNELYQSKRKTNTSGDTLIAGVVHKLKEGKGLEESLKFASAFVVRRVLGSEWVRESDYASEHLN